jgi:hypothetical protein
LRTYQLGKLAVVPFRETPEEWAERTGRGPLRAEDLDVLSSPVHDYYGTRKVFPVEILVPAAESLLRRVAEQGLEAEFIGNWWVQGTRTRASTA